MIKWPSAMYVKPGTTNTAWTFLTMFLKKKMSPGSVNHVPQCETLPSILLYIVYPGVATCIDYQSILSLLCFSLWDMISPLPLLYTCTCITAYIYLFSLSLSLSPCLSLSPSPPPLSLSLSLCLARLNANTCTLYVYMSITIIILFFLLFIPVFF